MKRSRRNISGYSKKGRKDIGRGWRGKKGYGTKIETDPDQVTVTVGAEKTDTGRELSRIMERIGIGARAWAPTTTMGDSKALVRSKSTRLKMFKYDRANLDARYRRE